MKVKIIGDSIAAGVGSSDLVTTNELIIDDQNIQFYKYNGPNTWWYMLGNYFGYEIENLGCSGIYSYQIVKHFDTLMARDADLYFILLGLNDRKRQNGLYELYHHLSWIVKKLKALSKKIILLTPPPSTIENENYPNRLFHTEDIVGIIRKVSQEQSVMLIDLYEAIINHLDTYRLKIEDVNFENGCTNDGLHPSNRVQKLMYEVIREKLEEMEVSD